MCGRYTLSTVDGPEIAQRFSLITPPDEETLGRFNVCPTETIATVLQPSETSSVAWGLRPFRNGKFAPINVRSETVAQRFKWLMTGGRCLVLADGWYEWAKRLDSPGKQPYYVTPQDGSVLAFAGLWEVWGRGDDRLYTCTIVTSPAVAALTEIHERMPLVLPPDRWAAWLDPARDDVEELAHPTPPEVVEALEIRPVSMAVNNVANNGPGLVARAEAVSAPADQPALF